MSWWEIAFIGWGVNLLIVAIAGITQTKGSDPDRGVMFFMLGVFALVPFLLAVTGTFSGLQWLVEKYQERQ